MDSKIINEKPLVASAEETSSAEIVGWFLPVAVAFGVIIALAILKKVLGGAKAVLSTPRSKVVLVGLAGAGKTVLFAHLCGGPSTRNSTSPAGCVKTQTSVEPNHGTAADNGIGIVDFPGHQRLRHELFAELAAAKKLVVVIDSVTIHDDKTEGAKELAGMLLAVLQSGAFYGVSSVLFACTKRDEVTSYSAKAVRRVLEAEVTRAIVAQGGAIGSLRGDVAKNVRRDASAKSAAAREECLLILDENEKFSFNSLSVPFSFVDCSVGDFGAVDDFIAQ